MCGPNTFKTTTFMMGKSYITIKAYLLLLATVLSVNSCMAASILERITRQVATEQFTWKLESRDPHVCRIKYNESHLLKHLPHISTPWGGARGNDLWNCYNYRRGEEKGVAFSTRGTAQEKFVVANPSNTEIVLTNETILAEHGYPEMIFLHKVDKKLGKTRLELSIAGEDGCYLHMIPGGYGMIMTKRCQDPPDGLSHFKVCFSEHGDC